jgi:hypothetical protein
MECFRQSFPRPASNWSSSISLPLGKPSNSNHISNVCVYASIPCQRQTLASLLFNSKVPNSSRNLLLMHHTYFRNSTQKTFPMVKMMLNLFLKYLPRCDTMKFYGSIRILRTCPTLDKILRSMLTFQVWSLSKNGAHL